MPNKDKSKLKYFVIVGGFVALLSFYYIYGWIKSESTDNPYIEGNNETSAH